MPTQKDHNSCGLFSLSLVKACLMGYLNKERYINYTNSLIKRTKKM